MRRAAERCSQTVVFCSNPSCLKRLCRTYGRMGVMGLNGFIICGYTFTIPFFLSYKSDRILSYSSDAIVIKIETVLN